MSLQQESRCLLVTWLRRAGCCHICAAIIGQSGRVKNSRPSERFDTLESFRGLAALGVAAYHSNFLSSQGAGMWANAPLLVDFFFVLSGFVLCHAYRSRIADGMPLREFALLRLARVYPLHVAMLAVWVIWMTLIAVLGQGPSWNDQDTVGSLIANLLMLNSVGLQSGESWNYPAWSIGAEFMAYLVFFWVIAGLGHRFNWRHALALSAVGYAVVVSGDGQSLQHTYDLGAMRCVGGFFLGVAVYFLHEIRTSRIVGTAQEIAVTAACAALLLQPPGSVVTELATLASFAALVLVFARSDGAVSAVLRRGVPMYLGRISYAIYMVHALVFLAAFRVGWIGFDLQLVVVPSGSGVSRFMLVSPYAPMITVLVLGAVIGVAAVLHRTVEEPSRRALRRLALRGAEPKVVAPVG
jgi:peptidoglycan/LPS O-acetylase OafA/YrhL